MKSRPALTLVLWFAGGVLLTVAIGGASGVFDRGPTEQDVRDARERGVTAATEQVKLSREAEVQAVAERGYIRGQESLEWMTFDRLPNPDSFFAGLAAGQAELERLAEDAFERGRAEGQAQGRDEALGVSPD